MNAARNVLAAALLVGFSIAASLAIAELAVRALDARRVRSGPSLQDELLEQARAAGVAADGFNIYYLGESTMFGVPFDPRMSIPKLLEYEFGGRIGGRPIHSVNLARSGQDLAFNLDRIDVVLAHPDVFHPSLIVAYVGHNEFLKSNAPHLVERDGPHAWQRWLARSQLLDRIEQRLLRAYPLEIDARARLDRPQQSPSADERVFERYQAGLAHLLDAAAARGVSVVLSTVAGNVADFEPSRSVYCGPDARRGEFGRLLDEAAAAASADRDEVALAKWAAAEAICDRFAELAFRRAQLLERRGDRAGAARDYQAALDHDATPLRASTRTNTAVARIGAERGAPVADPVARIAALGPRPAPGYEWFVDAHHPNVGGFVVIAHEIAEQVRERLAPDQTLLRISPDSARSHFALDEPDFVFDKIVERGRWFTRIATLRYDPSDRLRRAAILFAEANHMRPDASDPLLGLAMVAYLERDAAGGDREVAAARGLDAAHAEEYLATPWVRAVVARARVASGPVAGELAGPAEPGSGTHEGTTP